MTNFKLNQVELETAFQARIHSEQKIEPKD